MKNLFKNFNAIGFAALLIIGGTFAVNAESVRLTRYYFYDNDGSGPNIAAWHDVAPAGGLGLSCDTDNSKICSANFPSAPTSSDNTVANNTTSTSRTLGNLQ